MDIELNERIAVEVFGYQSSTPPGMVSQKWWRKLPDGYIDVCFDALPNYSEYMQYAWLVVEELAKQGIRLETLSCQIAWYCCFEKITNSPFSCYGLAQGLQFAPRAICLAALDIVEKLEAKE